jgi:hypothetical protein
MRFFVLERSPRGSLDAARTDAQFAEGFQVGDAPRCQACGRFIGMRPWLPPYRAELDLWGDRFGDLAFLTCGSDLLVSLRFMRLFQEHHLTGLSGFEPIEVAKVTRHSRIVGDPPPYFRSGVYRSGAQVDQLASGLEWEEPPKCKVCRLGTTIKRWKKIIIEPQTWEGDDIFIARGMPGEDFIVSTRFKDFCEAHDVQNAVLLPAENYGHDLYPSRNPADVAS